MHILCIIIYAYPFICLGRSMTEDIIKLVFHCLFFCCYWHAKRINVVSLSSYSYWHEYVLLLRAYVGKGRAFPVICEALCAS